MAQECKLSQSEIGDVFRLAFGTPNGQAALEYLEWLYSNLPVSFENANKQFFNAGKMDVIKDIKAFMKKK